MMLGRKALRPSFWCNECRLALVKAFISSSGLSGPSTVRPRYRAISARDSGLSRSFGTSHLRNSDIIQEQSSGSPISGETRARDTEEIPAEEQDSSESDSSIPWYLQVEPPQRASNPLLERQQFPPLPPDPPPLLQPMLEHVSKDLGLDDLTLLDLRKIDPPPALGANLLMIIGTARSEKHLHVSADRFCRWLKVTHKLSPYADGLLGRGELKLKLRRKARRAKLMSNVGSSVTGNTDDGIRTGWICVNVGAIQDRRGIEHNFTGEEGYVGFGSETEGARVVVQMLTQEKRDELDLEDLWGRMLERHERKEERTTKVQDGMFSDQEVGHYVHPFEKHPIPDSRFLASQRSLRQPLNQFRQARQLHQHTPSSTAALDSSRDPYPKDLEQNPKGEGQVYHGDNNNKDFQTAISKSEEIPRVEEKANPLTMGEIKEEEEVTESQRPEGMRFTHLRLRRKADNPEVESLQCHLNSLAELSRDETIEALGRDPFDHDSTPFLKSFYERLPQPPTEDHWELLLTLVSHGVVIAHPGYTKAHLAELSQQMQSSVKPPERVLRRLFRTFLTPNLAKAGVHKKTGIALPKLTKESILNAIMTLHAMHANDYEIETRDTRYRLYRAAIMTFRDGPRIRTGDPGRLMWVLDTLNARLRHSRSYSICLRMFVESCEILQRDPQVPKAERVRMVSAYLNKSGRATPDGVRIPGTV